MSEFRCSFALDLPCLAMASLPQPAAYDVQSKLKEMESLPLFMKSLPDDTDQPNEAVEALQALVHEGTPDGRALIHTSK